MAKTSGLFWNENFRIVFRRACNCILSSTTWIHSWPWHLAWVHFNIILQFMAMTSKWYFCCGFSDRNFVPHAYYDIQPLTNSALSNRVGATFILPEYGNRSSFLDVVFLRNIGLWAKFKNIILSFHFSKLRVRWMCKDWRKFGKSCQKSTIYIFICPFSTMIYIL